MPITDTANQQDGLKRGISMVKSYQSRLDGEDIRLVMYRRDNQSGTRYGVVTFFAEMAVSRDYRNGEELHTYSGNEDTIIDWVPVELANSRYANILVGLVITGCGEQQHLLTTPKLRLVHA